MPALNVPEADMFSQSVRVCLAGRFDCACDLFLVGDRVIVDGCFRNSSCLSAICAAMLEGGRTFVVYRSTGRVRKWRRCPASYASPDVVRLLLQGGIWTGIRGLDLGSTVTGRDG